MRRHPRSPGFFHHLKSLSAETGSSLAISGICTAGSMGLKSRLVGHVFPTPMAAAANWVLDWKPDDIHTGLKPDFGLKTLEEMSCDRCLNSYFYALQVTFWR